MLRKAHEWKLLAEVPKISKIKEIERTPEYYDFDAYKRLVKSARDLGPLVLALVLLGGDAGMRIGEILGLRRQSVFFDKGKRGRILVCDNDQDGVLGPPKGGKDRWVPMTRQLREVLQALSDGCSIDRARRANSDAPSVCALAFNVCAETLSAATSPASVLRRTSAMSSATPGRSRRRNEGTTSSAMSPTGHARRSMPEVRFPRSPDPTEAVMAGGHSFWASALRGSAGFITWKSCHANTCT